MNELDEIQAFFAEQLRSRRALPRDTSVRERAERLLKNSGRLSAIERLEIYREQFWLRHTSSLVEDFPGLSGILGQEAWAALIEGYLDAYPPRSFTLRDLGLHLPEYIASRRSLENQRLCQEMAALEVAYVEIFDAADAVPVSHATVASVPESAWAGARLVVHPALRLLELEYPVAALRRKLIEAPPGAERPPLPAREPQCLLVFRRELQMFHETTNKAAFRILRALTRRVPLTAACELAAAEVPEEAATIAENVGRWFQSWAARGFIIGIEV